MIADTADRLSSALGRLGSEAAFVVLARARELEARGRSIVHMEIGEPDFDTPEHIKRAGIAAIERNLTHYTPSAGTPELRDAIAQYAATRRGIAPFKRENVVITPGAKLMVWNVLFALLEPGDDVLISDPAYPTYASCAGYLRANIVPLALHDANEFRIDLDELAAKVSSKTKVLVLNSPQNPTGGVLTRSDMETIAELAQRHDFLILSDEIYSRNVYDGEFVSIASIPGMRDRTIIIDGFSKSHAMTGWRLGYGVMPEPIARAVTLVNNNTFACAGTFVQHAGIAAVTGPDEPIQAMVAKFRERRDVIVKGLNDIPGISCVMPRGAFYAFPNISAITHDDKKLALFLLEEAGVGLLGGSCFGPGGAGHLRISYAASLETLSEALARMKQALPNYRE